MKKLFAILALAVTTTAFAGSFTVESQHVNQVRAADQQTFGLSVRQELSKSFTGDLGMSNTQTDGTNALATRLEAGLTYAQPILGSVNGYVRTALGQKYSNTADFTYYSVEPGITAPVGPFTAKVGWRWRSAVDSDTRNDQTHTMRYTVSYPVTKLDTVSVRYDRVNGDNNQKIVVVGYTRSF